MLKVILLTYWSIQTRKVLWAKDNTGEHQLIYLLRPFEETDEAIFKNDIPQRLCPFLGLGCALFGGYLIYFQMAPIVFDKSSGMFSKGRNNGGKAPDIENPKNIMDLERHALQLLWKPVTGKKQYYSYDLNLVLKNGKRIFILSHADKNAMKEEVSALSGFLGKPLWDVVE